MSIEKLLAGFRQFRMHRFDEAPALFERLVREGQSPEVAVVACADSRVSPDVVLGAEPGDIFVVRNVANIVPAPGEDAADGATAAGLEYAVKDLKVKHVVVMGHSQCGGIKALVEDVARGAGMSHVAGWIDGFAPVRAACCGGKAPDAGTFRAVELAGIRRSLDNLRAYAWVREAMAAGRLELHGWYFDMVEGSLWQLDPESDGMTRLDA